MRRSVRNLRIDCISEAICLFFYGRRVDAVTFPLVGAFISRFLDMHQRCDGIPLPTESVQTPGPPHRP